MGPQMTLRLIQFACIAITAVIVWAIGYGFRSLSSAFSSDFPVGFMAGAFFAAALYGVICWIDPSSRPRGAAGQQRGPDERVN
jgi:hypothetical protein